MSRVKNARRTKAGGVTFHSEKEAARWQELRLLERGGVITNLKRQVAIRLEGRDGLIRTPTGRPMTYRADFTYRENGVEIIEDVKGYPTEIYRLKRAILAAQGVTIKET